jgi:hypothetical protein
MTSNHELVGRALGLLHQGLYPFVEQEMRSVYGDRWVMEATLYVPRDPSLNRPVAEILQEDVSALLRLMSSRCPVFKTTLRRRAEHALLNEVLDIRNQWAHNLTFPNDYDDAYRAFDSIERLLKTKAIGASTQADRVKELK